MRSGTTGTNISMPPVPPLEQNIQVENTDEQCVVVVEKLSQFINCYNRRLNDNEARDIARAIIITSNKYSVDYRVVTALVAIESSFRRDARSPSGSMGLGQLMPATARWLNVSNPFDPYENLNGAVKLLGDHIMNYDGDINFALGAYKMGAGAVKRNGISQPSTASYIKRIREVFDRVP